MPDEKEEEGMGGGVWGVWGVWEGGGGGGNKLAEAKAMNRRHLYSKDTKP